MNALAGYAQGVGDRLKQLDQTVAVAESSTGGLISASLLAVPGASAYYRGASVLYTREARRALVGLDADAVRGLEPLDEAMVARFAEVAQAQLGATWAVAELGVAGPSGSRYGHPPGVCVLAVDGPHPLQATVQTGSDDREANMWRFTREALALLEQAIADG